MTLQTCSVRRPKQWSGQRDEAKLLEAEGGDYASYGPTRAKRMEPYIRAWAVVLGVWADFSAGEEHCATHRTDHAEHQYRDHRGMGEAGPGGA